MTIVRIALALLLALSLLGNLVGWSTTRYTQARAALEVAARDAEEWSCVAERDNLLEYLDESLELAVMVCAEFKRRWMACSGLSDEESY